MKKKQYKTAEEACLAEDLFQYCNQGLIDWVEDLNPGWAFRTTLLKTKDHWRKNKVVKATARIASNKLLKVVVRPDSYGDITISAFAKTGLGGWGIKHKERVRKISSYNMDFSLGDKDQRFMPFYRLEDIKDAFAKCAKIKVEEDVVGKVAGALRTIFKDRTSGAAKILVKARTLPRQVATPRTEITFKVKFNLNHSGFNATKDIAGILVIGDQANLWAAENIGTAWSRKDKHTVKLTDPNSMTLIETWINESITKSIKTSIVTIYSNRKSLLQQAAGMEQFIRDLEGLK